MADCAVCRQPIHDTAYVDSECAGGLVRQLRDAADLVPELDTVLARQTRYGEPGSSRGGPSSVQPLVVNWPASIDADTIRDTVGWWLMTVVQDRYGGWTTVGPAGPICLECEHPTCERFHAWRRWMPPPAGLAAKLRWLAGQVDWLRHHVEAGEAFDQLAFAGRLMVRAVDRPMQRVDAGLCLAELDDGRVCQARLTSPPGALVVPCPACLTRHTAQDRRDVILREARDIRGTAAEIAAWLTLLGLPTQEATIRKWGQRKRLLADAYGRYHFGQATDLRNAMGRRLARSAA